MGGSPTSKKMAGLGLARGDAGREGIGAAVRGRRGERGYPGRRRATIRGRSGGRGGEERRRGESGEGGRDVTHP